MSEQMKAQGAPSAHVAFKCPSCGTVQSVDDLIRAGATEDEEDAQRYMGFTCAGRFVEDKGCDWTLGGLFSIHTLEIEFPDGQRRPCFELATPEQAQELFNSKKTEA